jgi:AraC-like DNA-binding protein
MIKNIFHLLIFLLLFQTITAQQADTSLKSISYDSLKRTFVEYRFSDIKKAKEAAITYYKKAILEKNDSEITGGSFLNAIVYDAIGQQDSAHFFIDMYISRAEKANDNDSYANGIYKKGAIYYHSRNFHEAISHYTKAYELVKHTDEKHKLAIISNSIGLVKNQFGRRKQALDYFKESLMFFEKDTVSKKRYQADYFNTLNDLGNTYTNLSEDYPKFKEAYLDSATIYNEKGLLESALANDLEINTSFLTVKGIIFQKQRKLKEAAIYLFKAEKQLVSLSFYNELPLLQLYIGKNYFLAKNYDQAIAYLLKVDALAEKEQITAPFFQETYILLAQCYEKKNDSKNAIKYYKRFKEKDTENDQISRKISEDVYKQYDIPSLKNKINQLESQSINQKRVSKTLLFISFGLLLLLILGFVWYRNRVRKYKRSFDVILAKLNKTENTVHEKDSSQSYTIKDVNIVKILQGLATFEAKKLFLHKNCTINFVAKKIHTNKTYLSKILQSHKQKKFVEYITDLRINYALSQLKSDTTFRKYDIKSIAAELGFNTAESFSKAFKKRTGIYPSFYIKNLNKLKD